MWYYNTVIPTTHARLCGDACWLCVWVVISPSAGVMMSLWGGDMAKENGTDKRGLKVIDGGRPDDHSPGAIEHRDGDAKGGKLTGKQSAYVRAILKGANQSDAYREAYNAENMSAQAIWTEAGRLFRHPEVSRRITAGREAQERQAVHSGASLRLHVERELFELTTNADSDQAKLRALELLGKLDKVGAFTERVEQVGDNMTAAEVEAELMTKLRAAFGETG